MPTHQIIWCAQSSMHYIIEGSTRYSMPLYLAIQMKEHLKNCNGASNDCVARWISNLDPADRISVKISDANERVGASINHSNISHSNLPLRSAPGDVSLTSFRG